MFLFIDCNSYYNIISYMHSGQIINDRLDPSGMCSRLLLSCINPLVFMLSKRFNYLAFQSFDLQRT